MNITLKNLILLLRKNLGYNKNFLICWMPVLQGIGIIIYFSLETEPQVYVLISVGFLLLVSLVFVLLKKCTILSLSVFLILLGFASVGIKAYYFVGNVLQHKVFIKDIIATIREISNKQSYKRLIVCNMEDIRYKIECVRLESRTQWDEDITIGDKIRFSAVIYPPPISVSPFSYDFSRIAYFKSINAVGFTVSKIQLFEKHQNKTIKEYVELIRLNIYKMLLKGLTEDSANILSALLIGKKDGIKNSIMEDIRNSGIAHLFAISGLHLSFVASLFFSLSRNVLVLSRRLAESYNIKKISSVIAIIISLVYLLIAGVPVSAQRAFIMVSCVFIGVLIDRCHNNLCSITVASFIILLFCPESLLSPSFQMSFAAVLALIASRDIFTKLVIPSNILQYFFSIVLSSLIASLATLPYVVYHFNYFSIVGIFTNLLAIPITTFFIMPLGLLYILLSIVKLQFCVSGIIESSVKLLIYISRSMSEMKSSIIPFHAFSSISILIITLGFLFLCLWKGSLRFFGLVLIILGFIIGVNYVTPDILFNARSIVVKESDGRLYIASQKNHLTSFVNLTWARQNGQKKILKHYLGNSKRLVCEKTKGCIYSKFGKKVLIAYDADYIIQNCLNVDLIIQFGKFLYPRQCVKQCIIYDDTKNLESYFIWITSDRVKIDKMSGNRVWNTYTYI